MEGMRLHVVKSLSELSYSETSLLLIDASLFIDFELEILKYVEKCASFSICVLPPDIPFQVMDYAEQTFKYRISIPISSDYFNTFCKKTKNDLINSRKNYDSKTLEQQVIPDSFSGYFCGNSMTIKKVRRQILRAAHSEEPVLILGETGTGKTTAANVIHTLSRRKGKKMVSVSLSTIVETLAESAFFGHRRGSYTNADYECRGYFEQAHESTLFLDELGVASLSVQAMLLTVLDTGIYKKVGDDNEQHADVRMIFATNADLEQMLRDGLFRHDLYFRIYDNLIKIPPLRAHKEDIREMVKHYLDPNTKITEEALALLEEYSWPGNIRELHKCLHRALMNCSNRTITADTIDFGDISFPQ